MYVCMYMYVCMNVGLTQRVTQQLKCSCELLPLNSSKSTAVVAILKNLIKSKK